MNCKAKVCLHESQLFLVNMRYNPDIFFRQLSWLVLLQLRVEYNEIW